MYKCIHVSLLLYFLLWIRFKPGLTSNIPIYVIFIIAYDMMFFYTLYGDSHSSVTCIWMLEQVIIRANVLIMLLIIMAAANAKENVGLFDKIQGN